MLGGGVSMHKEQIYIKKHSKQKRLLSVGGCHLSTGRIFTPPPEGSVQISLAVSIY